MDAVLNLLAVPLGFLMRISYSIIANYGWAVLLFTVLTRIVILPVSIWLHRYSIRLVKMTPDLLRVQTTYFGDKDRIAEEQAKLYKKNKYNPLVTLIPLAIQIVLLMGVIQVINHPLDYVLQVDAPLIPAINSVAIEAFGLAPQDSSVQLAAVSLIQAGTHAQQFAALGISAETLEQIVSFNTRFYGIDITLIPAIEGGLTILAPVVAALAAFLLCIVQNKANVLQAEQGMANQISTMLISVGLSAYLGYFVPMGVAIYWVAGNLVAIIQQYFLNAVIPPQKYIDYEDLEKSREKLRQLEATKEKKDPALARREKEDIKRFNSIANKHLVFYSESNGFYKYYKGIIEYILTHSNATIHYITSDPHDSIFERAKENPQIRAYYVGHYRLITLMMRMEADIVVMTMPDLENYQIKRSYIKKDIEYIHIPHGMDSLNLAYRKGSVDHFDTVFCIGKHQVEEVRKTEEVYGLPRKNLPEWGYSLLDEMRRDYEASGRTENERKTILIAPSWQEHNIVDSCLDALLENLHGHGYRVIVRPHPQHVRHQPERMEALKKRFEHTGDIEIQTDFSSNSTVFSADMVITDWSSIAQEFAFTTCKPVLFIDTPMKVMNPEYQKIDTPPINIWIRERIGRVLAIDEIDRAAATVEQMMADKEQYRKAIDDLVHEYVFNLGDSARVGGKYILNSLSQKAKKNH